MYIYIYVKITIYVIYILYIFSEYIYICIDTPNVATIPFPNQRHLLGDGFLTSPESHKIHMFFSHGFGCWAAEDLMKGCNALGIFRPVPFFFLTAVLVGCFVRMLQARCCSNHVFNLRNFNKRSNDSSCFDSYVNT